MDPKTQPEHFQRSSRRRARTNWSNRTIWCCPPTPNLKARRAKWPLLFTLTRRSHKTLKMTTKDDHQVLSPSADLMMLNNERSISSDCDPPRACRATTSRLLCHNLYHSTRIAHSLCRVYQRSPSQKQTKLSLPPP